VGSRRRRSLPSRVLREVCQGQKRCHRSRIFLVRAYRNPSNTGLFIALLREKQRSRNARWRCSDGGCRRRQPCATASPLFHPRNEPPSEERLHSRGMWRQNQYAMPPSPPGGNVQANHPWMLSLAYSPSPSLSLSLLPPSFRTHALWKIGTHQHTLLLLLLRGSCRSRPR